jgi:hypothetical protein
MYLKVSGQSEGFSTLLTHIRFLSSVNSFMFMKGTGVGEGFATLIAYIGFLFCVNNFML